MTKTMMAASVESVATVITVETATAIAARAVEMHRGGVMPLHIKQDGKLIETTEELERLIAEEKAANGPRS